MEKNNSKQEHRHCDKKAAQIPCFPLQDGQQTDGRTDVGNQRISGAKGGPTINGKREWKLSEEYENENMNCIPAHSYEDKNLRRIRTPRVLRKTRLAFSVSCSLINFTGQTTHFNHISAGARLSAVFVQK